LPRLESVLPFRQFVLKVHSRCDLACDHCYIYEHADQSWRERPAVISLATAVKAAERIAEHARRFGLPRVRVILHGGEPLLAGPSRLGEIVRALRSAVEPVAALDLLIQTNGVRLDEGLCELFLAEQVQVGISLDGDRAANDMHRRYLNGQSSYDQVLRAIALLRTERYASLYAGLLATIDVRSDPVTVYRALAALAPPSLDFLLPHGTWDNPPPGAGEGEAPAYADWLIAVFEEWSRDGRQVPARIFESIIETSSGGASSTESLGLAPSDVVVIETDGSIEQADSLKVAYRGAPATDLDIFRHGLDEAAAHPAIQARQQGIAGLSPTCRQCEVVTSCGGGLYAHRYRTGSGFQNPSVYCANLIKLITHVRARMDPVGATRAAPARLSRHEMSEEHFDALAAGHGDAASIASLSAAQRSVQRTLLRLVWTRTDAPADDTCAGGWELISRLDRSDPATVNEVLAHPYVRAWAERCLAPASHDGPAQAFAHLASIAAAAAVRIGASAELAVPVSRGHVHLPTMGRLRVGDVGTAALTVAGVGAFEVRAASGRWSVEPGARALGEDWQPVRRLHAADFAVALEDTDPFRDCHQWPAAQRLSAAEAAAWQAQFGEAWPMIEHSFPGYAAGVAGGLRAIMPLANDVPGQEISAAARQAFGAVAIALPAAAADLALLIIHEFQHVKLGALTDMFDLHDQSDRRLYFAPWREDPRPLGALLQGAYAHIAVTDFWRLRRHVVAGKAALSAAALFARWRTMTVGAIETLAGSSALTPLGVRFVAGMNATVHPWLDEPVPWPAAQAALRWIAERRAAWPRAARL